MEIAVPQNAFQANHLNRGTREIRGRPTDQNYFRFEIVLRISRVPRLIK